MTSEPDSTARRLAIIAIAALAAAVLVGCGNENSGSGGETAVARAVAAKIDLGSFPQTDGKITAAELTSAPGVTFESALLPAANDFVAGRENRFPFGVFDADRKPVWGPTVIYVADSQKAALKGPFPVQAHELNVKPAYRSKTAERDYGTIGNGYYTARLTAAKKARRMFVVTLTRSGGRLLAAAQTLQIRSEDPAPAPGEKAPSIKTDTLESSGDDIATIETRVPPDDMHDVSLDQALKLHKPIVLLFATPLLCASRVCGPVIDVAAQVQAESGEDVVFIHQEIFNDNDATKGYRKQVGQYGLTSEPFTFVIDGSGRVSTTLQGPFDVDELTAAVKQAKSASRLRR